MSHIQIAILLACKGEKAKARAYLSMAIGSLKENAK